MLRHRSKINLGISLACWLYLMPLTLHAAELNYNGYLSQQGQPQTQTIRDPFTPSALMFEVLGQQASGTGFGADGFRRTLNSSAIPKMRLRGFVSQDEQEPIALLEVAGVRTFLVREGDEINIDPSQPNSAIRITKITRLSLTIETGTLGSVRIQR